MPSNVVFNVVFENGLRPVAVHLVPVLCAPSHLRHVHRRLREAAAAERLAERLAGVERALTDAEREAADARSSLGVRLAQSESRLATLTDWCQREEADRVKAQAAEEEVSRKALVTASFLFLLLLELHNLLLYF